MCLCYHSIKHCTQTLKFRNITETPLQTLRCLLQQLYHSSASFSIEGWHDLGDTEEWLSSHRTYVRVLSLKLSHCISYSCSWLWENPWSHFLTLWWHWEGHGWASWAVTFLIFNIFSNKYSHQLHAVTADYFLGVDELLKSIILNSEIIIYYETLHNVIMQINFIWSVSCNIYLCWLLPCDSFRCEDSYTCTQKWEQATQHKKPKQNTPVNLQGFTLGNPSGSSRVISWIPLEERLL